MNIKILISKALCLWMTCIISVCIVGCKGEESDSDNGINPGKITSIGSSSLKSYAITGAVALRVNAENHDVDPDPGKFTFENFSITGEQHLDSNTKTTEKDSVPMVTSIEKGERNDYVLVLGYDYTGYASCRVSFTLGYEGTSTSIPVSIDVVDYVRDIKVSHLATGMKGAVSYEINSDYGELSPNEFNGLQDLKGIGTHADNLSFQELQQEYAVGLDDLFEFTYDEIEAGYASIPVQAIWACDNGSEFRTYANFTVCPSRIMEKVTVDVKEEDDDPKYTWEVKKETEELGMDKDADGNISFNDRDAEFYIAGKEGILDDVRYFSYKISPLLANASNFEVDEETGKVTFTNTRPVIELRLLDNLPAGEYVLVAHVKKLAGVPEDKQYVDIHMPLVKI